MKKEKMNDGPEQVKKSRSGDKQEKMIPNMGDKPDLSENVKRRKRKQKKLLKTPSFFVRILMICVYTVIILCLAAPFVSATFYITEDLSVTTDVNKAYLYYSTQEEMDEAAKNISDAIDSLVEKKLEDGELEQYQETAISLSTAAYDWQYHVHESVDATHLKEMIEKSKEIDRRLYTEQSVKKLNEATLEGQKMLVATVKITRSLIQLMFDGAVNGADASNVGGIVVNTLLVFVLMLLPVVGFFAAVFDRRKHIKNVISLICTVIGLVIIMTMIYPHIAIGSVVMISSYLLLSFLTILGFYTKQQENYIVNHPEKEAEFSEKHPQFLKALLNYKMSKPVITESEKTYDSAQNAKKRGRRRK